MNLVAVLDNVQHGYDRDKDRIRDLGIEIGTKFEVAEVSMGQYSTSIELKAYPNKYFNSVNWRFENLDGKPIDIYLDPRYNPYL